MGYIARTNLHQHDLFSEVLIDEVFTLHALWQLSPELVDTEAVVEAVLVHVAQDHLGDVNREALDEVLVPTYSCNVNGVSVEW